MLLCLTFFLTPHDSRAHIPQSNRSPRYSTSPSALRLDRSSTGPSPCRPNALLAEQSQDSAGAPATSCPTAEWASGGGHHATRRFPVRSNICIIFSWKETGQNMTICGKYIRLFNPSVLLLFRRISKGHRRRGTSTGTVSFVSVCCVCWSPPAQARQAPSRVSAGDGSQPPARTRPSQPGPAPASRQPSRAAATRQGPARHKKKETGMAESQ